MCIILLYRTPHHNKVMYTLTITMEWGEGISKYRKSFYFFFCSLYIHGVHSLKLCGGNVYTNEERCRRRTVWTSSISTFGYLWIECFCLKPAVEFYPARRVRDGGGFYEKPILYTGIVKNYTV